MKRLLLDTRAFLWWHSGDNTLGGQSQTLIADTNNEINISAATVWEIEIKRQLGKLIAPEDIESIVGHVDSYHYRSLYFTLNRQGDCLHIIEIRLIGCC